MSQSRNKPFGKRSLPFRDQLIFAAVVASFMFAASVACKRYGENGVIDLNKLFAPKPHPPAAAGVIAPPPAGFTR